RGAPAWQPLRATLRGLWHARPAAPTPGGRSGTAAGASPLRALPGPHPARRRLVRREPGTGRRRQGVPAHRRLRPAGDRRHVRNGLPGRRPGRPGRGRCARPGDQSAAGRGCFQCRLPLAIDRGASPAPAGRGAPGGRHRRSQVLSWPGDPYEPRRPAMPGLLPHVDPDGLLEYSVVFTDRALNHMSRKFQQVMLDISATLKDVYNAPAAIVMPGSGSFGMEGVARQFAHGRKCLVIRTGWFSYRWTQIFEMGGIPSESIVLKARPVQEGRQAPFAPPPIDEVVATIAREKPDLVFAPHVETAAGLMLPDDYMRRVADATHEAGGMFVLDCIASGTMWVDMAAVGVDILVSAPQKGWSGSPCSAFVMLGKTARQRIEDTTSSSFACDLRKWLQIMEAYESGGHAYHATMPTDALRIVRDAMLETRAFGFDKARIAQQEL